MVSYEVAPAVRNASKINHFQRLLILRFKCFSPGICAKQSKPRSGGAREFAQEGRFPV